MCLDCLYGLYLKLHYPYQFYTVMLQLYTGKGNKEKVAAILDEMRRYKGIKLQTGCFGQDNTNWLADENEKTISQNLSSIRFISKQAAADLKSAAAQPISSFVELLRYLQMETSLNTRQISVLIKLGYFRHFGKSNKLLEIFNEFTSGKNKLTKTLSEKSVEKRMEILDNLFESTEDTELPIYERLQCEIENTGLCVSTDPDAQPNLYFVTEVDDKFGVKVRLYSVSKGTSGQMRIKKNIWSSKQFKVGDMIQVGEWERRARFNFKTHKPIGNESDMWLNSWTLIEREEES